MATGKDNNYSRCSLCLDDGRNTMARHYCVECETYFCTGCVKCHKLPSLKSHQVNEVNSSYPTDEDDDSTSIQSDVPRHSIQRLKCTLHRGKLVDTFCMDHNEVCCGACTVVKHRSCTTVAIAFAAKDFESSPELKKFKEELNENLVQSKKEKEKRTDNLDSIGKQKLELIEDVDKYEEKIIARIKELANISRNEIREKYYEHKTSLDVDIETLDVVIVTNTEYIDTVEQMDDEELFVYTKTNQTVTKDGEMLLQTLTNEWRKKGINFCFDPILEKHVLGMKSLGQLADHMIGYKATFQSNINLNLHQSSQIFGLCLMENRDIILTDNGNNKLKRFDSNLKFKDELAFSGTPIAVCKTGEHEAAVRIRYSKRVQFVSVGQKLESTTSFTLANDGWGMTYDACTGEIFACEEQKVNVYSKTGNKLRTYDTDTNGDQLFSACRQIALNENKQYIYVTDQNKGLVVLDKSGTLKIKISLSGAWPLFLLPGEICLAGCWSSGVIVHVDKDGNQLGNLIDTMDGRTYTRSAVYDREHSRLIIGGYQNVLSVYTLSAKYK